MKISETSLEELFALPDEAKTRIVFGGKRDFTGNGIAALLLGCGTPFEMTERALAAAALFKAGRVPCVIPTGGVIHPTDLGDMTEAEYMAVKLREAGVPDEAVLLENQATNTPENMICGELTIERAFHPRGPFPVYVVTSATHLRRSLEHAAAYLPRTARIMGHAPAEKDSEGTPGRWAGSEFWRKKVDNELRWLKFYIDSGDIPDIEF